MSNFNAKEVQGRLEAILAGNQRQVAARCALYCSELVEAAREDERRAARERHRERERDLREAERAPARGELRDDGGGWTRGFFGDSFAKSPEVPSNRAFVQQPTLDSCHAERTNDRDCVWILRTAFTIRNKVINQRRLKESQGPELPKEIEEEAPSTSSLRYAKTILDPKLVERIVFFRDMVQRAVGLWQERLLDDTPCLTRSATTDCQASLSKALPSLPRHSWDGRTTDSVALPDPVQHARSVTEGANGSSQAEMPVGKSPYRHLISPLEPPNGSPKADKTRMLDSPLSASPKSRKEVQEDLGRELAQLAEDLRNAQIISSH